MIVESAKTQNIEINHPRSHSKLEIEPGLVFAMLFSLQPNAVLLSTYSTTPACLSTKCIHGT